MTVQEKIENLNNEIFENETPLNFLINQILVIKEELFEIYSVRADGKIYFWSFENNEEQYTTTIEEIHQNLENKNWALA